MSKVTIDRELLERELLSVLDFSESNLRRVVDHLIDVGYTLAAPRQPEGEGLEVVAYRYKVAYEFGGEVMCWEPNGRKVLETFPLADHAAAERAIAELREERDTLRQQLAEARDEICQHSNDLTIAYMAGAADMKKQRDKLAGLLRDARLKMGYMLNYGEWYSPEELLERIDAALDEVKPCQESPALTT